jgi:putative hydrolase of the HAD superfamily
MNRIQAVVLDLGNVLVFHDDLALFRRMSAWGGADPEDIRKGMLAIWDSINRGDLAGDELRRAVCQVAGSKVPMEPKPFFALWNCHFRLHRELLPVVESLLGRVKLVLLSNVNEMHWRFVRPLIPLFDRFDDLVLSYELRMAKPDPEIFQAVLTRSGLRAEETAYFDDVSRFVEAAQAVGIHARVFTDAPTFRMQLAELGVGIEI